jgi:actin-related protein 6
MAPKSQKQNIKRPADRTLIVDNGADTIKAGFASQSPKEENDCHIIPNCLAKGAHNRTWVGAQLNDCTDFADMTFRRPVQNGCLVNWEAEKEIWEQSFFNSKSSLYVCVYYESLFAC